eukprot:TRINITY_DN29620_c0_g1_i1.p1 TRINITY_DN29620_c0_g1~~TRINITY_DN29620_c0_g1_i1.p1  ORF type:complete len:220 (+),score=32.73 TRINITY_DN29620_c0_g1_i1:38-697(+)
MAHRLVYFPIAGRIEPTRLALAIGGIPFEDERIPGAEWRKTDLRKELGPRQLPLLFKGGDMYTQSMAMLRYACKISKVDGKPLYPEDPEEALRCDELTDQVGETFGDVSKSFRIADQAEREAFRAASIKEGGIHKWISYIDSILSKSVSGYAVGDQLTMADLAIFTWIQAFRSGWLDGIPANCLDQFPHIEAHRKLISNLPEVRSYYSKAEGQFEVYHA